MDSAELPRLGQLTITRDEAHYLMALIGVGDAIHDYNFEDIAKRAGILKNVMWHGEEIEENISHAAWHTLKSKVIDIFKHVDPEADAGIRRLMEAQPHEREQGESAIEVVLNLLREHGVEPVIFRDPDLTIDSKQSAPSAEAKHPTRGPAKKARKRRRGGST